MIHFFLEIWHLIESCNLTGWQQLKNHNSARYGTGGEISVTILVSILGHFQEKLMTKFFKKPKKPLFGTILGPFAQIWAKMSFPEKRPCQFLNIPIITIVPKIRKKLTAIPEKNAELMDGQTVRQWWFYKTLHKTGDQNTAKGSNYFLYSVSFFQMHLLLVYIHKNITNLKMGEKFKNLTVVSPGIDGYQTCNLSTCNSCNLSNCCVTLLSFSKNSKNDINIMTMVWKISFRVDIFCLTEKSYCAFSISDLNSKLFQ